MVVKMSTRNAVPHGRLDEQHPFGIPDAWIEKTGQDRKQPLRTGAGGVIESKG
jgi:hypothetical protein